MRFSRQGGGRASGRAREIRRRAHRRGGSPIKIVVYLAAFILVLCFLAAYLLFPALGGITRNADPARRKFLASYWALLLILIFALTLGLLLAASIARMFRPKQDSSRKTTRYVDAWAESGKRMKTPPPEEELPPE